MNDPNCAGGQARSAASVESSAHIIWIAFLVALLGGVLLVGLCSCATVLPREMVQ